MKSPQKILRVISIFGAALLVNALFARPGFAETAPSAKPNPEIVLFPFDDHGLPLNRGLVLNMVQGRKHQRQDPKHPNKPVLNVGKKGDPDFPRVYFYGTVIEIDGEYRMWYTGHDGKTRQVCYATSTDGVKWTKPNLGLVDYKGGKNNNLVTLDGSGPMVGLCALVLHEPEDPEPNRRFKMLREDAIPGVSWPVYAAYSADGINWQSTAGNKPINPDFRIEPSGLIKFNGAYYLNGHSSAIRHPVAGAQKRNMQTFVSYDFENWSSSAHLSFRRDNVPPRPILDFEGNRGEQVHVGASLWNRGNVILGFYGQYHNESNDRRTSTCDLGLIVSNDAIHFREPIPDFKIVPGAEEPDRTEPRLIQGQGFQNIGDRTLAYYGIWTSVNYDNPTGVRIATWPRDRLGSYAPSPGVTDAHCISMVLSPNSAARVWINASGLSPDAQLKVEVLDEKLRPIAGYMATENVMIKDASGFRLPIVWKGTDTLNSVQQPFRVRINFTGRDAEKIRLWAVYVQ